MAACGDAYAGMIKTSLGTTPSEPYYAIGKLTGIPSIEDWAAWRKLAEQLYKRAQEAFDHLGAVETRRGRGFPKWNSIVEPMNEAHKLEHDLGGFFTTSPADGIPQAMRLCEQSVCVLQLVDEALESLGELKTVSDATNPPEPTKWSDWILPALFVGGIGYAAYRSARSTGDE